MEEKQYPKNFLEFYDSKLSPLLGIRAEGFHKIFELLEEKKVKNYMILETGTVRTINEWSDGQSTRLFDMFVNFYQGNVYSVDISEDACATSKSIVTPKVLFRCGDSVQFLHERPSDEKFDLIYLDSFDVDFENHHPSSLHHIFELCSVLHKNTKPGTIIAIDDNKEGAGKGQYIQQYFDMIGMKKVYDGYQLIYQIE
jgi:hypothetical protein